MKMAGWLIKTAVTIVLISSLTVYTTYYIVDGYIQQLLGQMNIQVEGLGAAPDRLIADLFGFGGSGGRQDRLASQDGKSRADGSNSGSQEELPNSTHEDQGDSPANSGDTPPDHALPVMGQSLEEDPIEQGGIVLSPQDLSERKRQLSAEDRTDLMALLLSKLPQEELQQISIYMEDGLTETELRAIEQLIAKHLTEEEYHQVIEIFGKYDKTE